MKYAVIIAGGGGEALDASVEELDGFTPLEAADTAAMDALGESGRQGVAAHAGLGGAGCAALASLMGIGGESGGVTPTRETLEAIALAPDIAGPFTAWHAQPVTMDESFATIEDAFPAGLTAADSRSMLESVREAMAGDAGLAGFRLIAGAGPLANGGVLIGEDMAPAGEVARADALAGTPVLRALGKGANAELLRRLCELSADVLQGHPVNELRRAHGLEPVSMLWFEGGARCDGIRPGVNFAALFGVRAAMVTGDAGAAGLTDMVGIDRLAVPGVLVGADADLGVMASHAIEALDRYDLVIVHTDAMTGCSLAGDWRAKRAFWSRLDEEVVGRIHARLMTEKEWRLMVACDSVCSCARRARTDDAAAFVMAGSLIRSVVSAPFSERASASSDLKIEPGNGLMEYFLYSGLRGARKRAGPPVSAAALKRES